MGPRMILLLRPYAHYAHFSQVRKNNRGKVIILFYFKKIDVMGVRA